MTMTDASAGAPAGQDMGAMPGMDMGAATSDHKAGGTALPPGNAPAPAPPTDHYADRTFPPGEMERVRADLHKEHGGERKSGVAGKRVLVGVVFGGRRIIQKKNKKV